MVTPSKKNPHGRTGNRTRHIMISSQELWPLDHEAGQNRLNGAFMISMVKRNGSNDLIAKVFHESCVSVTDVQLCEEF
jgi:hypothetical protein